MIKSILYERNSDGTFKITYKYDDENSKEISLTYLRVDIGWHYPARINYFAVPIAERINVLADNGSKDLFTLIVTD